MYKTTVLYLLILLFSGCAKNLGQQNNINRSDANINSLSTEKSAEDVYNKANVATRTPSPIPSPIPLIDDSAYIVTKFNKKAMKKTSLEKQPEEIIKQILNYEDDSSRKPQDVNIQIQERDFNRDGLSEIMVYVKHYANDGLPALYIFRKGKDNRTSNIFYTEGSPEEDIPDLEFLTKPNSNEFDAIKSIHTFGEIKNISYFQMINGKYEKVFCQKITPIENNIVSCQ